jgi:hypothetical protein
MSHAAEDPDDPAVWMPDLSYDFTSVKISPVDGLPADIAYNTRFANISSQAGGAIGKSVEVTERMRLVGGGVRYEKAEDLGFIMAHVCGHTTYLGSADAETFSSNARSGSKALAARSGSRSTSHQPLQTER